MIEFFVRKYPAVFAFMVLIIGLGLISYFTLPRESAPEIKQPVIFITTPYMGVAAKDIENLISVKIEDELEGMEGLTKITSSSQQGISSVVAEFASNVLPEIALRRTQERVDIAKPKLPSDAEEPIVQELNFSNAPIFIMLLSNPNGLTVLDRTIDFLETKIKKVKGVLDVNISGKLTKEVAIELDPFKLKHYGLSIKDVTKAIGNENVSIPGGLLKNKAKTYNLSVTGEIKDAKDFAEIIISNEGKHVKLSALGTVSFKFKDPDSYTRLNGVPAISLAITKRTGANLIKMVDEIKNTIDKYSYKYPSKTDIEYSFDQSTDIRQMVADLENNIITGALLVLLVTFIFLGFTNSIFVALSIPFSMLLSFFILQAMDITLNMVVLFSLILALGMLVDNGIVIVENIYRHATLGKSRVRAAIDGAQEVALPIIASTITTILAFFPIIFMPGIMGEFLAFIPKTIIVVLSSSLLVGLTINPVICSRFLKVTEENIRKITQGSSTFVGFQNWYCDKLSIALDNPWKVILGSFLIVFAGFFMFAKFGKEAIFFPNLDPAAIIIDIEAPQGTPLIRTDSLTRELEAQVLSTVNSIKNYQATSGKGHTDDFFSGTGAEFNKANIRIGFKPYLEREVLAMTTLDSLKTVYEDYTGAIIKVVKQADGPPQGHPISYEVSGEDYQVMGSIAQKLYNFLNQYKEFEDVDMDYESAKPEIRIEINREKAARYGLSTRNIATTIRNTLSGSSIGKFREGKEEYDVNIRLIKEYRDNLNSMENLEIVHEGKRVPLSTIATITNQSTVGVIKRKNLQRAIEIWADFKQDIQNKEKIKEEVQKFVESIELEKGYSLGVGEGEAVQTEAMTFLGQAFLVAIFLILIVLILQFNSITQPIIILISVVLSIGGVLWGFFITQMVFVNIMCFIGIIGLAGVVVNNAIVLIDYINLLVKRGNSIRDALLEAGKARLRPVLLTAITTICGMLPMAFAISFDFHTFKLQVGSESAMWWKEMAWTMIFGLSFATIMTLFVVPILMELNYRFFPPKELEL